MSGLTTSGFITSEAPQLAAGLVARLAQTPAQPISQRETQPTVPEQIALQDAQIRKAMSVWIMVLFAVVNLFTLGFIVWLTFGDRHELKSHLIEASGRLVDAQVVMALLGATTVQLGTIAVIMARYVFKAPEPGAG